MGETEQADWKKSVLENFVFLIVSSTYKERTGNDVGALIVHAYDDLDKDSIVKLGSDDEAGTENPIWYVDVYSGLINDWDRLKVSIDSILGVIV